MRLTRIMNQCHPIPGFVYQRASFADDGKHILIPVRPRKRSRAICSGCHQPAAGYDQSHTARQFEFIGIWGYLVFLVYYTWIMHTITLPSAGPARLMPLVC